MNTPAPATRATVSFTTPPDQVYQIQQPAGVAPPANVVHAQPRVRRPLGF
jgi:hypothetical protein